MKRPGSEARRRDRWRVLVFALAAVGLHFLVVPVVGRQLHFLGRAPAKISPVKVVTLSPSAREALRKSRQMLAQQRATRPAPPPPEERLHGQVVDLPPAADQRAPDHADYLAEHNSRVEKETRSRYQAPSYRNSMNEPTVTERAKIQGKTAPRPSRAIEVGPEVAGKDARKGKAGQRELEVPAVPARDRVALRPDAEGAKVGNHPATEKVDGSGERLKLALGEPGSQAAAPGSAPEKGPNAVQLIPPLGVLARLSGGPSNDYLPDLEEGDGTFLNAREFKYASFFNRMKRDLSSMWRPMDEYRRRDPTGNIYGYRSRETVLEVTLDADGKLKSLSVSHSSGLDFLDSEAMAAFQKAQPFPNPPKGLMGPDGTITFPFGFHVDFGRGF